MADNITMEKTADTVTPHPLQREKTDVEVGKVDIVTADLDDAEIFLRDNGIHHSQLQALMADEAAVKKLVRKVDLQLMPLLCGTYFIQFIDKQAISFGAVFDLFSSTHMTSSQYSWMASIFYLAYLVSEWPASYLVQRLPAGRVLSACVLLWGTVLLCTAAAHDFAGLAACRFLLGVFESVVTPAFMLIVAQWYTGKLGPSRAGLFYSFNGIAAMVGGVLFFSVGDARGWQAWRIIYVICGGTAVVWSLVLFWRLPDSIMTARAFSVEERAMLISLSAQNRAGVYSKTIKGSQIKEALCDTQTWLLFFYMVLNEMVNGGIANFSNLIVKGFTHSALETTLWGIGFGATVAFFMFTGPWCCSRFTNVRTIVMQVWNLPSLVAVVLNWKLQRTNKVGLLFAYYLCPAYCGGLIVALQMASANFGGYTKRTTTTAIVFLGYCIGNIVGPHAFLGSQAPIYQTGMEVLLGCIVGQVVLAAWLRVLLIRRNKARDAQYGRQGALPLDSDNVALLDLTDKENTDFRYVY